MGARRAGGDQGTRTDVDLPDTSGFGEVTAERHPSSDIAEPERQPTSDAGVPERQRTEDEAAVAERHPTVGLDDVVHQRVRLGILAVLHATDSAEFAYLKQVLELTDGNLNRHLEVLAQAGFVISRKSAGRRRTIVTITDSGRRAFTDELAALQRLADAAERPRPM